MKEISKMLKHWRKYSATLDSVLKLYFDKHMWYKNASTVVGKDEIVMFISGHDKADDWRIDVHYPNGKIDSWYLVYSVKTRSHV